MNGEAASRENYASDSALDRLLVFNLATDADDPILGFTIDWLQALASRVGVIDVVTMRAGTIAVPDNVQVYSVGKELGYSEPRRATEFFRILRRLLGRHSYDACFAHMMPLFAVMGALPLRRRRIPMILWYAHGATSPTLRLAERLVDVVVSPSPESFRLRSRKVRIVGHGIDTEFFRPGDRPATRPVVLLAVGRISPVKRLELLVEALSLVTAEFGRDVRLRLVGPADEAYVRVLLASAERLGVADLLDLAGPMRHDQLLAELRAATVALNASATGSLDKAVLEALAVAVPVVVANEAFGWLPPACRARPDAVDIADRVVALLRAEHGERSRLGAELRQFAVVEHSLPRLADRLVDELMACGAR